MTPLRPMARLHARCSVAPAAWLAREGSWHAYLKHAVILKNMNPKIRKKSPIHENADANITCNFGDGDISRLGVAYLTHVGLYITTSIIIIKIINDLLIFKYKMFLIAYMLCYFCSVWSV